MLKINSYRTSKVVSRSISLMLTLTWGTDILFDTLKLETWRLI